MAASSHRGWAGEAQDPGGPRQLLLDHELRGRSLWGSSLSEPGHGWERPKPQGEAEQVLCHTMMAQPRDRSGAGSQQGPRHPG